MTCFLCFYVNFDGYIVIKGDFFSCHVEGFAFEGSIPFFALVHTFFCSMLSEGVLVFRGSVLHSCICLEGAYGFCAPFYCSVDYVFSSRLC